MIDSSFLFLQDRLIGVEDPSYKVSYGIGPFKLEDTAVCCLQSVSDQFTLSSVTSCHLSHP